ncbi:MAG: 16S rRNA (adenine(1518)-N(6)/adenine(1519)-N(6))-dimethyltransferase RsmA [Syntrophobacteraceae bacterium]|nr:16S rRNA (adenine(1518)-N(6)/adenine(1519)-N(6))-dimethyltransferase RsmA [Desulfobacteraceae bacterium]
MFLTPQDYFRLQGTSPRKRFGQHFLVRRDTAERIVECAGLSPGDVAVEVGPGLGALTRYILPRVGRLHLVELDRDLAAYLESGIQESGSAVAVHPVDVLDFDFLDLGRTEGNSLVLLGNLPYNISSPLVFHLLESMTAIRRAVFMVQKEVGERLAAGPGTKDYGVLSVLLGIYARVTRLFTVGPSQFYPPPKVDSLVLRIDFEEVDPVGSPSFAFLRSLVNTAFQQRRKTLQNSLKSLPGKNSQMLSIAFAEVGIDPMRRPETLEPSEFRRLAKILELGSKAL